MKIKTINALDCRGAITFTPTDPPRPHGTYVYQRVAPGLGNVLSDPTRRLQLRAYVIGANPNTAAQQTAREKFRAAVIAWHALSPAERTTWENPARKKRITAFNAFVSSRLRA